MTTVAVVPLRDGISGKTRLAAVLDPLARSRLIGALARHVVGVLLDSPGIARVVVVTADPVFAHRVLADLLLVDAPGANPAAPLATRVEILHQPPDRPGLVAALDLAREQVVAALGTDARLLVAHADLPALTTHDVAALLATDAPVVVASDRVEVGTNLLLLDAGARFTFRFGPGSRAAHVGEAELRGVRAVVVHRPGTSVDLDTLDDWAELPEDVREAVARTAEIETWSPR